MFHEYKSFTQLPPELEKMCLDLESLTPFSWDAQGKKSPQHATYRQYHLPSEVREWLYDNKIIVSDFHVKIHAMFNDGNIHPHIDYARTQALNYLLTDDGSKTCWYKHKTISDYEPSRFGDYLMFEDVELLCSEIIDSHRWHVLDTATIHGVIDIKSPRIAITVPYKLSGRL